MKRYAFCLIVSVGCLGCPGGCCSESDFKIKVFELKPQVTCAGNPTNLVWDTKCYGAVLVESSNAKDPLPSTDKDGNIGLVGAEDGTVYTIHVWFTDESEPVADSDSKTLHVLEPDECRFFTLYSEYDCGTGKFTSVALPEPGPGLSVRTVTVEVVGGLGGRNVTVTHVPSGAYKDFDTTGGGAGMQFFPSGAEQTGAGEWKIEADLFDEPDPVTGKYEGCPGDLPSVPGTTAPTVPLSPPKRVDPPTIRVDIELCCS